MILLAIIIGILSSILISFRQKILFKIVNKNVSINYLWLTGYASSIATILLPFFSGGLTFSYLISKEYKITFSKVFGIVLLDFIIGLFFTVIFGLIGTMLWSVNKPIVAIVFVVLFVLLIFFIIKNKSFKILKVLIKSKENIYKAILITFLIFICVNLQGYLFFMAFDIKINIFNYTLATALFGLLNLIPGLPTKIGQYELLGTVTYWYLLGIDKILVGKVLLTQHLISMTTSIIIGIVAAILLKSPYAKKQSNFCDGWNWKFWKIFYK